MPDLRQVRVSIKYKPPTGTDDIELPFDVGVLSDLSGDSDVKRDPLNQRKFANVTAENFDKFLKEIAPALNIEMPDYLTETGKKEMLRLVFKKLGDLTPDQLVEQGSLKKLKDKRDALKDLLNLLGRGEVTDKLSEKIQQLTG